MKKFFYLSYCEHIAHLRERWQISEIVIFQQSQNKVWISCYSLYEQNILPSIAVSVKYRWSNDEVSVQYRCSIGTVSVQYRSSISEVSVKYIGTIDVPYLSSQLYKILRVNRGGMNKNKQSFHLVGVGLFTFRVSYWAVDVHENWCDIHDDISKIWKFTSH